MKTIKLIMVKGEIDTSCFNQNKFPNKEDIIRKIAQKLKKSLSEIRKMKSLVNDVMQQKIDAYIDTKIVKNNHWLIKRLINKTWSSIDDDINDNHEFNGWQEKTSYNPKNKTFNVSLSYKNRIGFEMYQKYTYWYGSNAWDNAIKEDRKINKDLLNSCPKFVKAWINKDGKKEIEFIEKTLEELGKVKIEVYNDKNKKLDTFYVQYKRTGLTFDIPNNLKKQFKLN